MSKSERGKEQPAPHKQVRLKRRKRKGKTWPERDGLGRPVLHGGLPYSSRRRH